MIRTLPLILVVAGSAALFAAPPAVERALPSVALLLLEDAKGQPKALGSGFFIKRNIIATSLDLVAEAKGGYAKVSGQNTKYDIKGVVATDVVNNLALIEVEGANVQPLKLGDDSKVEVGDRIYALGNPKGLKAVVADGIVSGIHKKGQDRFFQITAAINPGSNGGPVLDEQGNLIGVGQSFFSKGKLFSIVVPSSFAADLNTKGDAAFIAGKLPAANRPELLAKSAKEIIECDNVLWGSAAPSSSDGIFSLSIRNKSASTLKNIVMVVIFHDSSGKPINSVIASSAQPVKKRRPSSRGDIKGEDVLLRPKSVIRISAQADEATHMISEDLDNRFSSGKSRPKHTVTFQLLSFEIVEGGKGRFDPSNPFGN